MTSGPPSTLPPAALGPLIQGLSLLCWALPLAVVICVQTARTDWLRAWGLWPAARPAGLVGGAVPRLAQIESCHAGRPTLEKIWLLALIAWGSSPFLSWHGRVPQQPWFESMVLVAAVVGVLLLLQFNRWLRELAPLLADPGLHKEMAVLVPWNRAWLRAGLGLLLLAEAISHFQTARPAALRIATVLDRHSFLFWVVFLLAPLAMTLALLWKTKAAAWNALLRRAGTN